MNEHQIKRIRVDITAKEKKALCLYKEQHPQLTQVELCSWFLSTFNKCIARNTVSDMLRTKQKWLSLPEESGNLIRDVQPKEAKLEEQLWLWFFDIRTRHNDTYVSDNMFREKAREIGSIVGVSPDFRYSNGWLSKFKKRHDIKHNKLNWEIERNFSQENIGQMFELHSHQLKYSLEYYDPNDIFCMCETGLLYQIQPSSTLLLRTKKLRQRITVVLSTNVTGTDKLKPFVIGKYKEPKSFFDGFKPEMYVYYSHNQKAVMTPVEYLYFLKSVNKEASSQGRRICLLVDPSHSPKSHAMQFSNLSIYALPPNTNTHPMKAGIIRCVKARYRHLLSRHYIDQLEIGRKPSTTDLRQCIGMLSCAWDAVTIQTIQNCWRHAGVLPPSTLIHLQAPIFPTDIEAKEVVEELRKLLQIIPEVDTTPEDLINVDNELVTCSKEMTPFTHHQPSSMEIENEDASDEEDEAPLLTVTPLQARLGLYCAMRFFEQNGDEDVVKLMWKLLNKNETLETSESVSKSEDTPAGTEVAEHLNQSLSGAEDEDIHSIIIKVEPSDIHHINEISSSSSVSN